MCGVSADAVQRSKAEKKEKKDDEEEEVMEFMSAEDAWWFPIVSRLWVMATRLIWVQIGSVALLGLYLVVKYLGEEWINWLLGWYFSIAGVGSVWNVSAAIGCWDGRLTEETQVFGVARTVGRWGGTVE